MVKLACLPDEVDWNDNEFTKEMLDYMRAVYCVHPMVIQLLDMVDELIERDALLAEREAKP